MDSDLSPNCPHRWVLENEPPNTARCVLCSGTRTLQEEEIQRIQSAQASGLVFLRWPQRLETSKRPKARATAIPVDGAPREAKPSAVTVTTEIPEGFIPVGEAAQKLNMDAKKLRKSARSGRVQAIKVGGAVYVKLSSPNQGS